MKFHTLMVLNALVLQLFSFSSSAQQGFTGTIEYRVTAVKQGQSGIISQSNVVEVLPDVSFYVPNAFTPNSDGLNDLFGVKGEGIDEFNMKIFDRWGEMIFESNNPHIHWDGTYHGQVVQQGVYVYEIYATNVQSRAIEKHGTVTLIQ